MRFMLKIEIPMEQGNKALRDPDFGKKMQQLLAEIKAEAAYFTTVNGRRGGYVIVNMDDASQLPGIAEPFFLWLSAKVEAMPVMLPEDLGKAGPAIGVAVQKWG